MKSEYLFAIGLIALVVAGAYFSGVSFSIVGGGLTVNSISPVGGKVISNDADIANTQFIIQATTNGAQTIVGDVINQDSFKTQSGYDVTYPMEIGIKTWGEQLNYRIVNQKVPIYKVIEQDTACGLIKPDCPAAGTGRTLVKYGEDSTGCGLLQAKNDCFYLTQVGLKGMFDNPDVKFAGQIYMKVNNYTDTEDISNTVTTVNFADATGKYHGSATWTGSLVTGDSAPSQAFVVPIWSVNNNQWEIKNSVAYDNYDKAYDTWTYTDSHINSFSILSNMLQTYKNDVSVMNTQADTLLSTNDGFKNANGVAYATNWNNRQSKDSAGALITVDRRVNVQQLTFYIDAAWVGVKIPVGKPKITGISCTESSSGGFGEIDATVQNVGASPAVFEGSMSNCPAFIQSYSGLSNQVSLTPGASGQLKVQWTGGTNAADITQTCTLNVHDTTKTTNFDVSTISCHMKPPELCNLGEQKLISNCIYECQDVNKASVQIACCDYGVKTNTAGKMECNPKPGENNTCTQEGYNVGGSTIQAKVGCCLYGNDGKTELVEDAQGYCRAKSSIPDLYNIAIVGLISIFGAAIGYFLSPKRKSTAGIILGLIAGVIVGLAFLWFSANAWWITLTVGIVAVLFLFFVLKDVAVKKLVGG